MLNHLDQTQLLRLSRASPLMSEQRHTSSSYNFLLLTQDGEGLWQEAIREALKPIGTLTVIESFDAKKSQIILGQYDLIILGPSLLEEVLTLIRKLRSPHKVAQIVVATHATTWRGARAAFRAGAVDYMRKTLDVKKLRTQLLATLDKMPPLRER